VSHEDWQRRWRPDAVPLQRAYLAIGRWSGRPLIVLLRLRFGPVRRLARWWRAERGRLRAKRAGQAVARSQVCSSDSEARS